MKTKGELKRDDIFQKVKKVFTDYLEKNQQRKTNERFIILEEIYSCNDHFDAESLYDELISKKHRISRATIYNTLELLVDCDLVTKHQFGNNLARYEKSFGYRQHDHLICVDCNKVLEFCDPRIHQISTRMGELLQFEIAHHSLILYGRCNGCEIKKSTAKATG